MIRALALFAICFTVATGIHGQRRSPDNGQCNKEEAAYDEVRLRAMASQTSLELLREYSKALDESYEATRKSAYANSVVDVASLAAGWPLSNVIQDRLIKAGFMKKVEQTLTEKLIKGSFASVEKALLKDPTLNGIFENATGMPGTATDLIKEYNKHILEQQKNKNAFQNMFGDDAAESINSVFDLMEFGLNAYQGMSRLEGIRALSRATNDQIVQLSGKHTEQMEYMDSAQRARDICYDRFYKNLPPDTSNRFWADVIEYLGPNWRAPEVTEPVKKQSTGVVNDSRFYGSWNCPCSSPSGKVALQLNEDGTASWTDSRGGPPESMYENGTYTGTWWSAGDSATVTFRQGPNPRRYGTLTFTLNNGQLVWSRYVWTR